MKETSLHLYSSCDIYEPIFILPAQVTRVHPALLINQLVSVGLVPEVAHADVASPGHDLPHPLTVCLVNLGLKVREAPAHAVQSGPRSW